MNAVASPHSLRARQRLYLSFWILGEEFEPGFDRGLAVRHALATEEGLACPTLRHRKLS
jgi:hypothetical protein